MDIIRSSCISCHTTFPVNNEQAWLPLHSVMGVYYVVPGVPANSLLWQRVNGIGGYMPPPPTFTPLPQNEIDTITDWIANFNQRTVTMLAQPSNGGTVTGGGIFTIGLSRTITASANPGWTFFHWDDGNTFNPRNIIVPSCDITYTAIFLAQTPTPTPTSTPATPTPTPTSSPPPPTPTGTPTPTAVLRNISTRSFVQTVDSVMIGGFIVQGSAPKRVIIRAIGPELIPFGVPNVLFNPTLELHNGAGALIASNDNWRTTIIGGIIRHDQVQEIRDSGRAPTDGRESAIIATLPAGKYTAIVRGVNGMTGIALGEVYDLSSHTDSILRNISTRSFVQTADSVMIGGFIVQGSAPERVIIRAIGPELIPFGVPNVLFNPTLELHNGAGALIASNDNWRTTIIGGIIRHDQVQEIRDSGRAPTDGRESAIIATLPAGKYTAIVRGVNGMTGIALVEVYDLD